MVIDNNAHRNLISYFSSFRKMFFLGKAHADSSDVEANLEFEC